MDISKFREQDVISISGKAGNRKFTRLYCTIISIYHDNVLKVAPDPYDFQLTEDDKYFGRIWFDSDHITEINLIERNCNALQTREADITAIS